MSRNTHMTVSLNLDSYYGSIPHNKNTASRKSYLSPVPCHHAVFSAASLSTSISPHYKISIIIPRLPLPSIPYYPGKSENIGFWSSRKDKNLPPSVPTGKKRKGSIKSVQQAAKFKENTKHATAATSGSEQGGDRSTNGTDASRHSFYENNSAGNNGGSYHARCDTSDHPENEERNHYEAKDHERGKQESEKEARRKQMGYGNESSRVWHE
ncbi:hypothetical protein BPAE_0029g00340 [Botrytis paeoniae]|uniref:Uncharacterized protein n=1 Tax=Botrytis paeoniae TaxID=278948 RepID=A0A4Z1FUA2_9HELO|nr:hypothetical protein BPAE_0029g00340 [Botrytis paeoniae]